MASARFAANSVAWPSSAHLSCLLSPGSSSTTSTPPMPNSIAIWLMRYLRLARRREPSCRFQAGIPPRASRRANARTRAPGKRRYPCPCCLSCCRRAPEQSLAHELGRHAGPSSVISTTALPFAPRFAPRHALRGARLPGVRIRCSTTFESRSRWGLDTERRIVPPPATDAGRAPECAAPRRRRAAQLEATRRGLPAPCWSWAMSCVMRRTAPATVRSRRR